VTDWRRNKESLLGNSEPILLALFAENRDRGDVVAAVGYVFEFGRGQLCVELCANTARNAQASLAEHQAKWPDASADEVRRNSGDYDSAVTPPCCLFLDSSLSLNCQDSQHGRRRRGTINWRGRNSE
jgi:hypothetical protein